MMNGKLITKGLKYSLTKRGLQENGPAQKTVDKEVLEKSKPYVPLRTGRTIKSGDQNTKIGSGKVIYKTPYVRDIYYNPKGFHGAPQRGNRWFERMKTDHRDSILKAVAKETGGRGGN